LQVTVNSSYRYHAVSVSMAKCVSAMVRYASKCMGQRSIYRTIEITIYEIVNYGILSIALQSTNSFKMSRRIVRVFVGHH